MDPHIFVDPDPGSQNFADPDPKHLLKCQDQPVFNFFPSALKIYVLIVQELINAGVDTMAKCFQFGLEKYSHQRYKC